MTLYDALIEMIALSREKAEMLPRRSRQKLVFLLYYERMLDLVANALELLGDASASSSAILIRSALECSVDMINLSQSEHYLLVLRAIVLENRYDIFRYKTPPLYELLIAEQGGAQTSKMGKDLLSEFQQCLKEATKHYPDLRNNPRNLSVISRFRIANKKSQYYTLYTWLSMQSHNDLEPLLLSGGIQEEDIAMARAQSAALGAAIIHLSLELMVDSVHAVHRLFGPDDGFIGSVVSILETVEQDFPADFDNSTAGVIE